VPEDHDDRAGKPLVIPEIVTLPREIDVRNADRVTEYLCAPLRPGVQVLIADLSLTEFCDSSGIRSIVIAHDQAIRNGTEFRLVIPSTAVLRVLSVLGLDRLLQVYPSLGMALTTSPGSAGDDSLLTRAAGPDGPEPAP
jgi:anti-sigma B factor antagonist